MVKVSVLHSPHPLCPHRLPFLNSWISSISSSASRGAGLGGVVPLSVGETKANALIDTFASLRVRLDCGSSDESDGVLVRFEPSEGESSLTKN